MPKVIVHRNAARYLQRLPRHRKEQIKDILKQIGNNLLHHPDVKNMHGEWTGYRRLRAGNLRIIFWFDEIENIVYVDYIGPRGDIYK